MSIAGCFDFRMRASSFDMHQLAQRHKLAKFTKIFRSRSDTNVKGSPSSSPLVSPKDSPMGSPGGQPRRRFARVVKDAERKGEEYENPHVIRRYTPGYVEEKFVPLQKWNSTEEACALPYDPQEDSILKKGLSVDTTLSVSDGSTGERSPPIAGCEKHASFKEEVEIIEYDKKVKIQKCVCLTHKERLHDDSDSDFLEDLPEDDADKENSCCEEKSLKDACLSDIVNAEKAVNRSSEPNDLHARAIKKTKRQDEIDIPDDEDDLVDQDAVPLVNAPQLTAQ
eukprot:GHVO01002157.1.p1 GENE.GHVO01002157.1~~GHVO01002157.1.p1  ORF type:complete len:281 (+),score=57.54 GHVO01002157.1:86-928(+)